MLLGYQSRLARSIKDAVRRAFHVELQSVTFQYPPRIELGDLALTVPFDLARTLRRKPREIAEKLVGRLPDVPGIRKAQVAGGGYVNLFLDRGAFALELHTALAEPSPRQASRAA